jgi:hypothetical protein
MNEHPDAWPFKEPVDSRDVPDYYDIIKDPIGKLYGYSSFPEPSIPVNVTCYSSEHCLSTSVCRSQDDVKKS